MELVYLIITRHKKALPNGGDIFTYWLRNGVGWLVGWLVFTNSFLFSL
ncbi:hypothetical protein SynA15127_02052 [Synechococcus sp. A15-127]|nr:hypothetical protein SynA15127_02052 [Synechococcus sp. A15-127]